MKKIVITTIIASMILSVSVYGVNQPPVAQCQDVTVGAGPDDCLANADIDNGSVDPDGDPITITQSPEGPYSLGVTAVTLTVTDGYGNTDSCVANVTVVDTTPPVPFCQDVTVVAGPTGFADADINDGSYDACGGPITLQQVPAGPYLVGGREVILTVTDASGNTDSCRATVRVLLGVAVDIKPGSCPNPVNVESRGVLSVAILGTDAFDVSQVDPDSVVLEGVSPLRSDIKDVATPFEPFIGRQDAGDCTVNGPDGFADLTLKFDTQEVVAALGDVSDGQVLVVQLTGNLLDGTSIAGEDVVVIISKAIGEDSLSLGDDDYELVSLGFTFPYQGQKWTSVFVNSNGNLTFLYGDTDFSESVSEFLSGPPRIAALWDDLNPTAGGEIAINREGNSSMTVSFIDVPEFFNTGSNTFSIKMSKNGTVDIVYGTVSANDGLVGVTEGGGASDPGQTDLSAAEVLSVSGTTYQQFDGDPFDLDDTTLDFLDLRHGKAYGKVTGETSLPLGDDDSVEVSLGFTFPYQGQKWTSVFVNSNGNLTFGSLNTDFTQTVPEFLSGSPRIAALWDDLNPSAGGEVTISGKKNSLTVSFIDVPEWLVGGSNTFSITLKSSGTVDIVYGAVSANDGLVGVTEGGGAADPGVTDLSAAEVLPVSGTTYQQFNGDPFDLEDANLKFRREE